MDRICRASEGCRTELSASIGNCRDAQPRAVVGLRPERKAHLGNRAGIRRLQAAINALDVIARRIAESGVALRLTARLLRHTQIARIAPAIHSGVGAIRIERKRVAAVAHYTADGLGWM